MYAGDFNAKHTTWNCGKTNTRGKMLKQITDELGAVVLTPDEPTFTQYNQLGSDILDILIHSRNVYPSSISVIHELESDHLPVIATILANPKLKILNKKPKRETNWEVFKNKLNLPHQINITCEEEIDLMVDIYTNCVNIAVNDSLTNENNPGNEIQNGLTADQLNEVKQLIKEKNLTRKKWQKYRNPIHKQIRVAVSTNNFKYKKSNNENQVEINYRKTPNKTNSKLK